MVDQDILWLDVPMDDVPFVNVLQHQYQLVDVLGDRLIGEPT